MSSIGLELSNPIEGATRYIWKLNDTELVNTESFDTAKTLSITTATNNGLITDSIGNNPNTLTLKVYTANAEYSGSVQFYVIRGEIQKLSSITIGNDDDRVVYGTAEDLIANFTGNGTIPAVTWSASPEGIVEITDDGKIKALKMGDATISAKVEGADYSVEPVTIKTYIPAKEIKINTLPHTEMLLTADKGVEIVDSTFLGEGGGFRGSLLNTLALIGLSLVFAFPLGVGAAIYLGVYAKETKVTSIIRSLIDMISGVPSIIFGLAGALIFIPVASLIPGTNGGNLLSGALTMTMILLPTIVKTVEESIKVIPKSLTQASLALGASKTETVFKVVLPNSLPGILTSLLLSIGRIIGESAALVFAMGTTIAEYANMNGSNATLAVHIWVILGGDHPAYDNACAIAIVIIIIVLILTLLIKLIAFKMNKFKVR